MPLPFPHWKPKYFHFKFNSSATKMLTYCYSRNYFPISDNKRKNALWKLSVFHQTPTLLLSVHFTSPLVINFHVQFVVIYDWFNKKNCKSIFPIFIHMNRFVWMCMKGCIVRRLGFEWAYVWNWTIIYNGKLDYILQRIHVIVWL